MKAQGTCRGCGADMRRCDCEETAGLRKVIVRLREERDAARADLGEPAPPVSCPRCGWTFGAKEQP